MWNMRWIEGKKLYKKKERIGELERKSQSTNLCLQVRFIEGQRQQGRII